MDQQKILVVENLSKKFFLNPSLGRKPGAWQLSKMMFGFFKEDIKLTSNEFWAVKNISFELRRGEAIGIMGMNGAGKSTLLKILLGRLSPDSGRYQISGSVGGLVELGAGFHPEMTGMENIYNKARLLGVPTSVVESKIGQIMEFADLGDFINSPVKTYSSGMNVRLGFSIAIHFVEDLILCDEVLAVGDFDFRQKCLRKINELRKLKSFVLVSHSNADVANFCDKAIILHKGAMVFKGPTADAIEAYAQCSHHLSGEEVRQRIEKSLSLKMKAGRPQSAEILRSQKRYFFSNCGFGDGLEHWIYSAGDAKLNLDPITGLTCSDQNGDFVLKQEIDRECSMRIIADLYVQSGELELVSSLGEKFRVVNKWPAGFKGKIDESFASNSLGYQCMNIDRFPGGLDFNLKNIEVRHDIDLEKHTASSQVISNEAKLALFGPEYHDEEVVADVTLEWNLRKREQGYYYVSGDYFVIKMCYTLKKDVADLRIGIPFFDEDGQMLLGPDTRNYGKKEKIKKAGRHELCMVVDPLPVNTGRLWFSFTICEDPAHLYRKHITWFDIINPSHEFGLVKSFPVWVEDWRMPNSSVIFEASSN